MEGNTAPNSDVHTDIEPALQAEQNAGGADASESENADGGVAAKLKGMNLGLNLGIRARLFAAFGTAAAMTVVASSVAWVNFQSVGSVIDRVIGHDIPAVTHSLHLAEQSAAITAAAPSLVAAADADQLAEADATLAERAQDLKGMLGKMDQSGDAGRNTQAVSEMGQNLIAGLSELKAAVANRLELQSKRESLAASVSSIHGKILGILSPEVDGVNFDIVMAIEDGALGLDKQIERLRLLMEVQSQSNLVAGLLGEGATAQNAELIQPVSERFIAAAATLEASAEKLPASEAVDEARKLIAEFLAFGRGDNSIFALRRQELEALSHGQELLGANRLVVSELSTAVQLLVSQSESDIGEGAAATETAMAQGRMWLLTIALGALAVAGAIMWLYVGRNLVARLVGLGTSMRELADGNLDTSIQRGGNDEITEMAEAVEVFKQNSIEMRRLEQERRETEERNRREKEAADRKAAEEKRQAMQELAGNFEASVKGIVETVSSASTEMQTTADSMLTTAEETTSKATTVATASEEASTNVQTVASAAEEMSGSIDEIGRQVTQSTDIAGKAVSEAQRTNESVQGLAEAAQKIGEVVNLIRDIAEQTNLLALNATIEAARAGDAGKGFAVVASEVKSLANQTAKATEEIAGQIGSMQSATGEAVDAIKGIGSTIEQINEIATAISAAVEEQGAATQEIARNVQEAARGTTEVSSNITGVNQAASETGASARQVLDAASQLSREADGLKGEVGKFLAEIRAA